MVERYSLGPSVTSLHGRTPRGPLRPDFLGAYPSDLKRAGIVLDTKWSLPDNHQGLVSELEDVTKYRGPLLGWPRTDSRLDLVDLALLCHDDEGSKAVDAIRTLLRDDRAAYAYLDEEGYSLWTWGEVRSAQGHEVIRISKAWGAVSHQELDKRVAHNVDFPKVQFLVEGTYVKFVGDEPPLAYVILVLIQAIHAYIFGMRRDREKIVSLDDLYDLLSQVFPPIGEQSGPQLTKTRLREALEVLAGVGYSVHRLSYESATRLALDSNKDWYRLERRLPRRDLYDWICAQIQRYMKARSAAGAEHPRGGRRLRAVRKGRTKRKEGQVTLHKFE